MRMRLSRPRSDRASAMLMVLWGMMIMAMAVGGLITYMRGSVLEDIDSAKAFEARLLAQSGVELGLHPDIKKNDPLLRQQVSAVKRYEVKVSTLGARLAINQIAVNENIRDSSRRLFILWGLDPEKAGILTDSLVDWVDADDEVSPLGAEEAHYTLRGAPQFPRNQGFRHVDEMLFVRGMHELARRKANWKDYFTLHGDGLIDVNEASSELLEVVCDVTRAQTDLLVLQRNGADTLENTEDDEPYTEFGSVQEALGLSKWDFEDVLPRLTLAHPIRRIESTGYAGDSAIRLIAIVGAGMNLISEEQASPSGAVLFELSREERAP